MGVHCGIYKGFYNVANTSCLNLLTSVMLCDLLALSSLQKLPSHSLVSMEENCHDFILNLLNATGERTS
jgi:hypothetical protein